LLPAAAPGKKLLDVGCGTGHWSAYFARRGFDVTGVDIAPDMIEVARTLARNEGLDNASFEARDYERPLDGLCDFDAALFFDALHHAEDHSAAIAAAFGALKPGGVCVVSEPGVGHATSPDAVRAREQFGVTERDMPPALIVAAGRRAGFRTFRVLPHAFSIHKALFEPAPTTGVRRLLRFDAVRALAAAFVALVRKRRGGIVVMKK
jgi:2-polyprenyl-3-methyl-5-hydroxy-6-metoxy-1,4-benzoquinol methylase